jgi:protein-tyrosine phosphatase
MNTRVTLWPISVASGRLWIAARPRGGDWLEDDLRDLKASGVDTLVSMLTADEAAELELQSEAVLAKKVGLAFANLAVDDRSVPADRDALEHVLAQILETLRAGHGVAVHCRMGIGRSSLVVACTLVRLGIEPVEAWRLIESGRGRPVPDTEAQRSFVNVVARS